MSRSGAAMVEFAVIVPLMFLIIIGSVEVCNTIFLKQFLTEVSYQGAMEGARIGSTEESIESSLRQILNSRGQTNAQIIVRGLGGSSFDTVGRNERFEVIINAYGSDQTDSHWYRNPIDLTARSVGARQ